MFILCNAIGSRICSYRLNENTLKLIAFAREKFGNLEHKNQVTFEFNIVDQVAEDKCGFALLTYLVASAYKHSSLLLQHSRKLH